MHMLLYRSDDATTTSLHDETDYSQNYIARRQSRLTSEVVWRQAEAQQSTYAAAESCSRIAMRWKSHFFKSGAIELPFMPCKRVSWDLTSSADAAFILVM